MQQPTEAEIRDARDYARQTEVDVLCTNIVNAQKELIELKKKADELNRESCALSNEINKWKATLRRNSLALDEKNQAVLR